MVLEALTHNNMDIIGICGNARSGKDTMADLIIEILADNKIRSFKTSFADEVKEECRDLLMKTIGIDSFTEETEDKNIIRPLLVTWGTEIRRKLNPNIWIEKLQGKLKNDSVAIISDVRFLNEFEWIKKNGGYCIFIDRVKEDGSQIPPANNLEEENNLILRQKCDFHVTWVSVGESNKKSLKAVVVEVLNAVINPKTLAKWTKTFV
jgi:hypothetical protein